METAISQNCKQCKQSRWVTRRSQKILDYHFLVNVEKTHRFWGSPTACRFLNELSEYQFHFFYSSKRSWNTGSVETHSRNRWKELMYCALPFTAYWLGLSFLSFTGCLCSVNENEGPLSTVEKQKCKSCSRMKRKLSTGFAADGSQVVSESTCAKGLMFFPSR